MESDRRTPTWHPADFHITPGHTVVPSGANGFHGCFFGGEAGCISLCAIRLRIAIANLTLGKDAMQEALPEARNGCRDARHFRDVNSGADDHGAICPRAWITASSSAGDTVRRSSNTRPSSTRAMIGG